MSDFPTNSGYPLERWILAAAVACAVIVLAPIIYLVKELAPRTGETREAPTASTFVA